MRWNWIDVTQWVHPYEDALLVRYYVVGEGANFQDVVSLSPPYSIFFRLNSQKSPLYKAAYYADSMQHSGLISLPKSAHKLRSRKCSMQCNQGKGEDSIGSMQTGILSPYPSKSSCFFRFKI